MSYPISVVVPTKNRYKYLKSLIELIIGFDTDELELVIQDNSDDNSEILEFLSNKQYDWLNYYYCPDKLTSIQNFDKAINNSNGEYVTFIGDDDGIVRNIVDCAKWMKRHNLEALRAAKATYQWMESGRGGTLFCEKQRRIIEYISPPKELEKILRNGCHGIDNIPVTYVGIVKREVLSAIYNDYGTYFPGGASADIANGVALCFYVKRYVKLNIPILITGASKVTGGVSDRRKPMRLSELSFIADGVEKNWEGNLPKFWLGVIVWPESAIKALRAVGKETFINYVDFDKIIARAVIRARLKVSDYYVYCSSPMRLKWEIICYHFKYLFKGGRNKMIRLFTHGKYAYKSYCFTEVKDIKDAEKILSKISNVKFENIDY